MVTEVASLAHTSDIKHTYGPLRPNYFNFSLWRLLTALTRPLVACDWPKLWKRRQSGILVAEKRRGAVPLDTGSAHRDRTPNHYSGTEFKWASGRGREERKKGEKKREKWERSQLVRSCCGLKREVWSAATRIHIKSLEFLWHRTPSVCTWISR